MSLLLRWTRRWEGRRSKRVEEEEEGRGHMVCYRTDNPHRQLTLAVHHLLDNSRLCRLIWQLDRPPCSPILQLRSSSNLALNPIRGSSSSKLSSPTPLPSEATESPNENQIKFWPRPFRPRPLHPRGPVLPTSALCLTKSVSSPFLIWQRVVSLAGWWRAVTRY